LTPSSLTRQGTANKADLELVAHMFSMYRKQPTAGDRWTSPLAKELKV
jgi:hypothetical protein